MSLNDRKTKILEAIINDYIATAEPIGSRTIARKYDLGISSATVRNEMSDLEEMGLIIQPHTSSGRIPSDKGYRLYVDSLMRCRELTRDEVEYLKNIIAANIDQIDYLMKETARAISILTRYTAVIAEPQVKSARIKYVQLMPYDEKSILGVVVTDNKAVKHFTVRAVGGLDAGALNALSGEINKHLAGLLTCDLAVTDGLLRMFPGFERTAAAVINALIAEFQADEDIQVYLSGTKNILDFPEFSNIERAREVFQALEEKRLLLSMLGQSECDGVEGVEIVIGDENSIVQMKNCSVIKANFHIGEDRAARLGIIGPTRMDYSQVSSILNGIVKKINAALMALSGGG
jgi:heat-inducible transcriptional repressor